MSKGLYLQIFAKNISYTQSKFYIFYLCQKKKEINFMSKHIFRKSQRYHTYFLKRYVTERRLIYFFTPTVFAIVIRDPKKSPKE